MDRSKWEHRIEFLEEHLEHLSQWETRFISSLSKWLRDDKDLSMKQSFKLGDIFHRVEEKIG